MTKQLSPLEALERIIKHCDCNICDEELYIVGTALKDYEELQKVLDDFGVYNIANLIDTLKNIRFLEKQNTINSKELKALKIIKTVAPNVFWVMRTRTYKEYKRKCNDDSLLETEYNLLKEVLL